MHKAATPAFLRRWLVRIGGGAVDQGCFSGAGFVLHVLLARWLPPEQYGEFVVAFSLLLFLIVVHNALVLEPINVIGPSSFADAPRLYLRVTLGLHGIVVLGFSLITLAVVYGVPHIPDALRAVLGAVAIYAPAILSLWFLRRYCYYLLRPELSLWGSVVYILSTLAGLVVCRQHGTLDAVCGMRIAGGASLLGCLCLLAAMRIDARRRSSAPGAQERTGGMTMLLADVRRVADAHWHYGRWLLAGSVLAWVNTAMFAPLLGLLSGLREAASLRAVENVFMPMQQMLTALAMIALPWVSRAAVSSSRRQFGVIIAILTGGTAGAALVYTAVMILSGPFLFEYLYGKQDYYRSFLAAMPLMGIAVLSRALGDVGIGCAVRVLNRTRWLFTATVLSTLLTVMFGYQAVIYYGVYGALGIRALSGCLYALILFMLAGPCLWGRRQTESVV